MAFSFTAHRGSNSTKTVGTTTTISPDATVTSDAVLIVAFAGDNMSLTAGSDASTTCSDDQGNIWNLGESEIQTAGSPQDGATASIFWSVLDTALTTDAVITVTHNNVTAKALGLYQFSAGTTDLAVEATAGASGTTSDAFAIGFTGGTSREYLLFANVAYEYAAGEEGTSDADYTGGTLYGTSGGGPVSNIQGWPAYRIATLTTDQYDAQLVSAHDWAGVLIGLYENVSGAQVNANVGQWTWTEVSGTIVPGSVSITGAVGQVTWTGLAASVSAAVSVSASVGQITYTGISGTIVPGSVSVGANIGQQTWTGVSASVSSATIVTANVGQITHTGVAASIAPGAVSVSAGIGQVTYAGVAAAIVPGSISVTAGVGQVTWTGLAASIVIAAATAAGRVTLSDAETFNLALLDAYAYNLSTSIALTYELLIGDS